MEVSSHALALGRVYGSGSTQRSSRISRGTTWIFTRRWRAYFAAKQLLFRAAWGARARFAVINHDDEWAHRIASFPKPRCLVGFGEGAGSGARHRFSLRGLRISILRESGSTIRSPLVGQINVYNILAACAGAELRHRGRYDRARHRRCRACRAASSGWMWAAVSGGGGLCAHRRRAAESDRGGARLEAEARDHAVRVRRRPRPDEAPVDGNGRGGESDFVVLTSTIRAPRIRWTSLMTRWLACAATISRTSSSRTARRRSASAIEEAGPGDIVLIAGKGHETVPGSERPDDRLRRSRGGAGGAAGVRVRRGNQIWMPSDDAMHANAGLLCGCAGARRTVASDGIATGY